WRYGASTYCTLYRPEPALPSWRRDFNGGFASSRHRLPTARVAPAVGRARICWALLSESTFGGAHGRQPVAAVEQLGPGQVGPHEQGERRGRSGQPVGLPLCAGGVVADPDVQR